MVRKHCPICSSSLIQKFPGCRTQRLLKGATCMQPDSWSVCRALRCTSHSIDSTTGSQKAHHKGKDHVAGSVHSRAGSACLQRLDLDGVQPANRPPRPGKASNEDTCAGELRHAAYSSDMLHTLSRAMQQKHIRDSQIMTRVEMSMLVGSLTPYLHTACVSTTPRSTVMMQHDRPAACCDQLLLCTCR